MVEGFCRRVRRIASDAVLSFHASFAAEAEGTTPSRFFPLSPSFFLCGGRGGGSAACPGKNVCDDGRGRKKRFGLITVHSEE